MGPLPPPQLPLGERRLRRAYGMGVGRFEMTPVQRLVPFEFEAVRPARPPGRSEPRPSPAAPPPTCAVPRKRRTRTRTAPTCVLWTLCMLGLAAAVSVSVGFDLYRAQRAQGDSWGRRSWVAGRSLAGAAMSGSMLLGMAAAAGIGRGLQGAQDFVERERGRDRPRRTVRRWSPPPPSTLP